MQKNNIYIVLLMQTVFFNTLAQFGYCKRVSVGSHTPQPPFFVSIQYNFVNY